MERHKFSKAKALEVLRKLAHRVAAEQKFDLDNGTSQLQPKGREFDGMIERAVQYGRMRAFEEFAASIEDGFLEDA